MKTLVKTIHLLFILIILIPVMGCSSNNKDYNKPLVKGLLYNEQLSSYSIPAFLVRGVLLLTEDTRRITPALKGVRSITFSINEDVQNPNLVFSRLNDGLNAGNYTSIVEIINEDSRVTIKMLERNNYVREMVVLINDYKSIICISMKGRFVPKNILEVVANFA